MKAVAGALQSRDSANAMESAGFGWCRQRPVIGACAFQRSRSFLSSPRSSKRRRQASLPFLKPPNKRPFTAKGFGAWFHDRCDEATFRNVRRTARKPGATIAAENGATVSRAVLSSWVAKW